MVLRVDAVVPVAGVVALFVTVSLLCVVGECCCLLLWSFPSAPRSIS